MQGKEWNINNIIKRKPNLSATNLYGATLPAAPSVKKKVLLTPADKLKCHKKDEAQKYHFIMT